MCIFCDIADGKIPSRKIYEDDVVIAILDLSQATRGHTLVIPKKHFNNIFDVDEETLQHIITIVKKLAIKITANLNADGCNIVNNNNEAAGQSVMHLHFHIIPRYKDDDYFVKGTPHQYDMDEVLKDIIG